MKLSLSDAENRGVVEKLVILGEECNEVAKLVSKIQRFGIESNDFEDGKKTNKILLEEEIGDLLQMIDEVIFAANLNEDTIQFHKEAKMHKLPKYLKHQS